MGIDKPGVAGLLDFKLMSAEPAPPARGDNTWIVQVSTMTAGVVGGPVAGVTMLVTAVHARSWPRHADHSQRHPDVDRRSVPAPARQPVDAGLLGDDGPDDRTEQRSRHVQVLHPRLIQQLDMPTGQQPVNGLAAMAPALLHIRVAPTESSVWSEDAIAGSRSPDVTSESRTE